MKHWKPIALRLSIFLPLFLGSVNHALAEETTQDGEAALAAMVRDTDPLIGSWLVNLTDNTSRLVNPALYSFLPGGVLIQSETPLSDPLLNSLAFSNAHGAWKYDDENKRYDIRYFKLSYLTDSSYAGKEETTGTLRLNEKGVLSGAINVGSMTSAFSGTRIGASSDK